MGLPYLLICINITVSNITLLLEILQERYYYLLNYVNINYIKLRVIVLALKYSLFPKFYL